MNAPESEASSSNTLRGLNPGYYLPTDDEYRKSWEVGIIAVDASVALSLYRYSRDTRDQLLRLLGSFSDRLWLPHQAATEYERNRLTVIGQQVSAYDQLLNSFSGHIGAISSEFARLVRHPLLDQDELSRITSNYRRQVTELVEATRAQHPRRAGNQEDLLTDETRDALEQIFDGRVGAPYTGAEHTTALTEAKRRLEAQQPPGYLDKDKPEPGRYGDYLFWRQAVDRATELKVPLIILTDDEKEDWWWQVQGMTVGARPELIQEFADASSGERLLLYTTLRFIEEANRLAPTEPPVSAEAVGEVERLRTAEYEIRVTQCPFCSADVAFSIGAERTHTALPRCEECGERFHAFHLADGTIGTRRPGEGFGFRGRSHVRCPACNAGFETTLPTGAGTKRRACFQCGTVMTIDSDAVVAERGPAQVFTVDVGEEDCPGCGAHLTFVYRSGDEERTSCPECTALVIRPLAAS